MNATATLPRCVGRVCAVALIYLVTAPNPARAEPLTGRIVGSQSPYPAVEVTAWQFTAPRPIKAWTARVDLRAPDIEWVVTPRGQVGADHETACATTREFARAERVQLAINASPFGPFRTKSGEGMDVVGLSARDGDVYSPPHDGFGALAFDRHGRAMIFSPPITTAQLAQVDDAVGGFHVLLDDQVNLVDAVGKQVSSGFANVNPRTAVGVSQDGNTLWLIIVDGRSPGKSEGMTLAELAAFGQQLACFDLLNLDGGGSTSLVLQDPATGEWALVNEPVGRKILGTERLVANNLGLRIRTAKRGD